MHPQKQNRKKIYRHICGKYSYVCLLLLLPCLILLGAVIAAILVHFLVTSKMTTTITTTITTTSTFSSPCVNGNYVASNTCNCSVGWYGSTCALPNCSNPCLNGGTCSAPNTCTCTSQWNGSTCAVPICTPSCQNNGICSAPNVCNCTSSWNGSLCQIAFCNPPCLNGGNCTSPNNCTCDTSMWIGNVCQTPVHIFWGFDGNMQDLYNNFNGIGQSSPSYQSSGYNGVGSCLYLNRSMNQSVTIPTPPFLNMAYTSFTLEAWIIARTFCTGSPCTDNAIFGQNQNFSQDCSLHINVRSQRMYLGFFSDDLPGNQVLSTGQWYHVAYIYDYSTLTQYVYVNGYLDASRTPAGPYKGAVGVLTIGINIINPPNNFDGCLDSIAYFGRAKNASEVLLDATLVVYLSFDNNTLLDSGPLLINGTGTNYSYTSSGRQNTCVTLLGSPSYIQITGLRRIGTIGWPYSVAIWINPTNISGGTIMHLSIGTNGASGWCIPIMGLTSSGQIAINSWSGVNVSLTGPTAPLNTWTHVVGTYSSTDGERLYVNGTLQNSSGAYSFSASGVPMTITLGSSLLGITGCSPGTIQTGQFYGSLDEFYVYARELTASEVAALANV